MDITGLGKIIEFAGEQDAALSVQRQLSKGGEYEWSIALVWGEEADDSPMAGAASFGVGDTLAEAVQQVVDECQL